MPQIDFSTLKQNLELSERTDFVNLKAENERLLGDIERLKQKLREEISRTQAGVRLDLNLEKVRVWATEPGEEGAPIDWVAYAYRAGSAMR